MLIRGVTLRNIRSYEELELSFEEGITLLTGDIGAGKTTILAAIEFALFGLQRGVLDGDALLRHGTDEGSVTLDLELSGQHVTITRSLRRSSQGVRQTEGTLSINGDRESLSAQELKARILELLGYPEALLTKSKGLIFRHTVYTPQEEMKAILWLPAEERLNTLRTLFGIERYKTVTHNASLLTRELRAEERAHLAHARDLQALERNESELRERVAAAEKRRSDAERTLAASTTALQQHKTTVEAARAQHEQALRTDAERTRLTQRIRELESRVRETQKDLENTAVLLAKTLEPVADATRDIEALRAEQLALDQELRALARTATEARTKRTMHSDQAQSITTMHTCPVCKQTVTAEHKHAVTSETTTLIATLTAQAEDAANKEVYARAQHQGLATKLTALTDQQRRYSLYQRELIARADYEKQQDNWTQRLETFTEQLALARAALTELPAPDADAHERFTRAAAALRAAEELREERLAALRAAETALATVRADAASITQRLTQARDAHITAAALQAKRTWLEDAFLPAVTTVEAHVLASVHREFAELFTSHFTALIEDDTITVSLSEQFEPLVTQNGYDATLEQLSGGEKTAVALSYRLALYRVVSDFMRTITTRDLLVLDEPTDGFSTEQLARVRDVIRALGCRQVILVSHEQGMESACDHVIRVAKRLHRSEAFA